MFDRRCDGGSEFIAHVSVLDADESPGARGNVFRVNAAPSVTRGRRYFVGIATRWLGNDRVLVRYPRGAHVIRQDSRRDGVDVEYQAIIIGSPESGMKAETYPGAPTGWPADSVPRRATSGSP